MKQTDRLVAIMRKLRDPDGGCPWDLEQDFSTIAPHTIEEAYEVADAIERDDMPGLCDELGDLLLQVVFHAQMAEEKKLFDFADVVNGLNEKLVRRHPHVFAGATIASADEMMVAWEAQKAAERTGGVLDTVPRALPALRRAAKLGKRAASVGFDWPDISGVRAKISEEFDELNAEIASGQRDAQRHEFGDVLFALVNLGRHLGIDPETALQETNNRFKARFGHLEDTLESAGRRPEQCTLDELEALWQAAKASTGPDLA